jgi:hypothetical protein
MRRDVGNPTAIEQLRSLSQEISSHSKEAVHNYGTFERENYVLRAAANPDRRIEIGVLERYHGSRTKPDGSVQNYYRVTLAASIEERTGPEEAPLYSVFSIVKHVEELATVEAVGIRELDPGGTYLTVYRNAVINLAQKVREKAFGSYQLGVSRDAVVGNGSIDWKGTTPGAFTPLSWFRPYGEVASNDNKPLGSLYKAMQPSQGYLNAATVFHEKLSLATSCAISRPQ